MSTETSRVWRNTNASSTTDELSQVIRHSEKGMMLVEIRSPSISELHLTIVPIGDEKPGPMVKRFAEVLSSLDATVVRQFAFGDISASHSTIAALKQALDTPALPLTWVEGADCERRALSGFQAHAISGTDVRTIHLAEDAFAKMWRDKMATHCAFSALGPRNAGETPGIQARETFENLQSALAEVGMTLKDVARTWLFLDDILSWYGDFNRVRNAFFEQAELRPGRVPASTGVRGKNPFGMALTAAAWAAKPHDETSNAIHFVPSPRQCAATSYGSAFSRAVEISTSGARQLLVSGTASIEPSGKTAHVGDIRAQIELTMHVVKAILESRRMTFADTSRATAYFKSPGDLPVFQRWLADHGLSELSVVNTGCEICREDLLFELELDAITTAR